MKHLLLLVMSFFIFGSIACSSSETISHKVEVEKSEVKSLSLEDQAIIKKYNDKINSLDLTDRDLVGKIRRDSLFEISKIKDDNARYELQMEIYLFLAMYKEAYVLNGEMLKDSFSFSRLFTQCILTYSAQRPKSEYEKCYADLAVEMQKELKLPHNNEEEYIASKWGYLLFMYQSGHKEYEIKLKEMLNSIENEQLKRQFESGYELAVEQVESYKKLSHD